ncbi:single-stranded DNA-binding protein [Stenotrophomonas sp. W1S232]|jgi:single stranded DNA-binding protein (ssb)|uniref:Single-stranded DNA-binding protein n=1 Tax=Stenotrophomonas koreensis TaxID=266128 RepID=A0A0R0BNS8_9GAMM|nr:single-stranded DNA-binding protein [Stenotrophomonas koreensis]KRG58943.1 single-stranded DNA-binding protein [Stenotrophomonas koreensis]MBB1116181.1 single-stranded DNA-binding protein [Stenotrophomonas koreensis]
MARGINKVILVGNLGNDPEVKYTQSGMAITTLSLATTSSRKDRDGNQQEKTEWHRVKLFGKLGEIAGEYLRKGRQVYIEGRIEYGSYEKDGVKQYTTDIIADDMQMLGGREEGGGMGGERAPRPARPQQGYDNDQGGGYGGARSSGRGAPAGGSGGYEQRPQRPAPAPQAPPMDDFADDDIPF